jgi:aquaporin Z
MPSQDAWLFKNMHTSNAKYAAEFIGTFFLVLTVGCNVLTGSVGAALSIGAILMAMIFAVGPVSGAHLNPAVTLSVFLSTNNRSRDAEKSQGGSQPMDFADAFMYVFMQLLGGSMAGWTYVAVCGTSFTLAPVGKFSWLTAAAVEVLYTTALCYVVLNVATVKGEENEYFGLAIGFTVTAAALSIGSISGCSLNPAVSIGSAMATSFDKGLMLGTAHLNMYIWAPLLGGAAAALLFKCVRPDAANA